MIFATFAVFNIHESHKNDILSHRCCNIGSQLLQFMNLIWLNDLFMHGMGSFQLAMV